MQQSSTASRRTEILMKQSGKRACSGTNVQHRKGINPMRKYLLAGAAAFMMAAPAAATTDHSPYVGLEGGILFPRSQTVDATVDFTTNGTVGPIDFTRSQIGKFKYKHGLDV